MHTIRTPVLIVGGGLPGLTAAMLLAWRGVSNLVVERHPSTARWPLCRGLKPRTLELLRVVPGLEEDLRRPIPPGRTGVRLVVAESVTGRELLSAMPPCGHDIAAFSPANMDGTGQDNLEPILLRHARRLGAEVRFSTVLTGFTQDAKGVYATLRDLRTGAEVRVHADYLIAADGSRSGVRQSLGIDMHGIGTLSNNMVIFFQADIQAIVKPSTFVVCFLRNPHFVGIFVTTDDPNVGMLCVEYDPRTEAVGDFTDQRCICLVYAALGVSDLSVKVLDVRPWEMSAKVADRMQTGRAFLAGGAAHAMPPTGGLDSQTSMQDAADLAWKLAMVLQHKAGMPLLETYEAERQPVAHLAMAHQVATFVECLHPDRSELVEPGAAMHSLHLGSGNYRYRSAAIISDGPDDGQPAENPFHPTGRPGFRVPHVWLERDGVRISTLDLVGHGFVLFAGREGGSWAEAASVASKASGVVVACHRIGTELIDQNEVALTRLGITERGASLVRPDGFVAWRCRDGDANAVDVLLDVLQHLLFRNPQSCEVSRPRAPSSHDGDHPTFPVGVPSFA